MTDRPTLSPQRLDVLRRIAQPRPLEANKAIRPGTARPCVVHDVDGYDYDNGVRPYWAAKEVADAMGRTIATVSKHLGRLAELGAADALVAHSCQCVERELRETEERELGIPLTELGRPQRQTYYRLTERGDDILAAAPRQGEDPRWRPQL